MRELYEVIDKRIADAIGGRPVTLLRGKVLEVAPTGYRLAAVIDGQSEGTPDIPYDLALSPAVDDDVLILRRSDGLLFAFAILRRGELVGEAAAEAVEVFIACATDQTSDATGADGVWVTLPLTTTGGWDTDQMYASPDSIVIHHDGLYKVRGIPPSYTYTGGSPTSVTYYCSVYRNGDVLFSVATDEFGGTARDVWLTAGDVLTLRARAVTGTGTPPTSWTYTPRPADSGLDVVGYVVQSTTRTYGPEPVGVQAYSDTTQSLTSGTAAALALNQEDWDTDDFHSNVTSNTRLTVPPGKSGRYRISGFTTFAANGTGQRNLYIVKNGTTTLREVVHDPDGVYVDTFGIEVEADLASGDYIELKAHQSSGGNLNVGYVGTRSVQTTLTMHALSTYPSDRVEAPDRSIGAVVRRTAAVSVSGLTLIPWSSADYDTDGFWTAALPGRLTIPSNAPTGLYLLMSTIPVSAGGYTMARWYKNGADGIGADDYATYTPSVSASHSVLVVWAGPGDYFECKAFSGGTTVCGTSTYLFGRGSIAYLGSGSAATQAVIGTEVTRSTAQTILTGATEPIAFDADSPALGWWAASPNPTRVTVPETGWYSITAGGSWAAATTDFSERQLYLQVGSAWTNEAVTEDTARTGGTLWMSVSDTLYIEAGQYVQLFVKNGDSAAANFDAAYLRLVRLANGSEATVSPLVVQDAPGAKLYRNAAKSLSNATWWAAEWDGESWDTDGFWASGQPSRITIPAGHAGRYRFSWRWGFTGDLSVAYRLLSELYKNGSAVPYSRQDVPVYMGANYSYNMPNATTEVDLEVGDYVELMLYQANSSAHSRDLYVGSGASATMSMEVSRLATGPQGEKGDPGADVFAEGTSWPTSPTDGQAFRRLDIKGGMLFRYKASLSKWLSDELFHAVHGTRGYGSSTALFNAISADVYLSNSIMDCEFDVYVVGASFNYYVPTTHDGSNYWRLKATQTTTGGYGMFASTTTGSGPSGYVVGGWRGHYVPVGVSLDKTYGNHFHTHVEKVGSPGNLDTSPADVTYRIIGPAT